MKKHLFLILFILLTFSCDDGDLVVQNIDFTELEVVKCAERDVFYKLRDSEILFLEMPLTSFPTDATPVNTPKIIPISATNRVLYRLYDAIASTENICPSTQSATPNLQEQWVTTSGSIEITTTTNVVPNTAIDSPNATKIDKYNHTIILKNVVFNKPNGDQFYESYIFGSYQTSPTTLNFGFDDEVAKSSCDNRIFNFSTNEALILDLSNYVTMIQNVATTTPRTTLISADNKLTYTLYTALVNDASFCPTAATPMVNQTWVADNGVENISGIVEVETTTFGTGFQHTIHLKKVVLKRGNSSFTLGDDYIYGSFITN